MSVAPILQAASVLLVRGSPNLEIFVVRRSEALRFFGGFYAFPGGRVAPNDAQVPLVPDHGTEQAGDFEPPRLVAAARELFEETGVLVARQANGEWATPDFDQERHDLIADRLSFGQFLRERGLSLWTSDWVPLGRLVTPAFSAKRFDTFFFLVQLPPSAHPEIWAGELQEGRWTSPAAMLQQWAHGECLVSPPTLRIVQALRSGQRNEARQRLVDLFGAGSGAEEQSIFFAPDVQMVPLRTQSLPPSTHTNAYLVGRDQVYLLDPGSTDPAEQQLLFTVLDTQAAAGRRLTAIVLTHHHPDHVGAAAVCAERYQVPVWAHEWTARAPAGRVRINRTISEGEHLPLGTAADGHAGWHLETLHTPGHAPGHLAFYDPHYQMLFPGDMVSTLSSVVIAPPHGNLAVYLASLQRLRHYAGRLLLPAHGNPTARSLDTIDEALAHRAKREEMLIAALAQQHCTVDDLASEMYRGIPPELMRFARLQVLAGLRKLQDEGRAELLGSEKDGVWRLRSAVRG
jgi:glyoxylase-like metal-dependent hydrolase (beta-lactamase superfamily II)/8-oxo-dGTP pyrophosphatase MutT (NUDIX family)